MSFAAFVTGSVVGGSLVFGSLSYHFLRTGDGVELIPKGSPSFAETYLDIRQFTPSDWAGHKTVAAAVVAAKKESIFGPPPPPPATSAPPSLQTPPSTARQFGAWSALPNR
ncbi:MAG TPA: hypothetical protein VHZ24_15030 [Pirellulales bacterium]|jgi:hypothetical protein|nr:hypothetical protein [Pirellulales bacterium]